MVYSIIQLSEVEGEPAWDDPFAVVPIIFLKPGVKACEKGESSVLYPSMPHTLNLKETIKDFVIKQEAPPDSWGIKKCNVINVAANYELALELLAATKAKKKVPKRKRNVKNKDEVLPPISNVVKKIRNHNKEKQSAVPQVTSEMTNQAQIHKSTSVLTDISNTEIIVPEPSSASSISMSEVQNNSENDAEESTSATQLKRALFEMPEELANFGSGALTDGRAIVDASSPISGSEETHVFEQLAQSTTPIVDGTEQNDLLKTLSSNSTESMIESSPVIFEDGFQFLQENMAQSTSPSESVPQQFNVLHEPTVLSASSVADVNNGPYVIVSMKHFLRWKNEITSSVSKSVGRVVDQKVSPRLDKIELDVNEIKAIELKKAKNQTDILTFDQFKNLYGFSLPLKTYEDFKLFDKAILGKNEKDEVDKNYENFGSNLTKHIRSTSTHTTKSEGNCKAIIRRFVDDPVIVKFTAKKGKNKPHFNKTAFFTCMLNALLYVYTVDGKLTLNEEELVTHVGTLINLTRTKLGKAVDPIDLDES